MLLLANLWVLKKREVLGVYNLISLIPLANGSRRCKCRIHAIASKLKVVQDPFTAMHAHRSHFIASVSHSSDHDAAAQRF